PRATRTGASTQSSSSSTDFLLRPRPGADVDLPGRLVGGQRDLGAVEHQRLEDVSGEVIVAAGCGGALRAVPVVAPVEVDRAVAAGDGLNPGALRQPG